MNSGNGSIRHRPDCPGGPTYEWTGRRGDRIVSCRSCARHQVVSKAADAGGGKRRRRRSRRSSAPVDAPTETGSPQQQAAGHTSDPEPANKPIAAPDANPVPLVGREPGPLSAAGMSTRAIAPTVGAPRETVRRDVLAHVTHSGSPEPGPAAAVTAAVPARHSSPEPEHIDPVTGEVESLDDYWGRVVFEAEATSAVRLVSHVGAPEAEVVDHVFLTSGALAGGPRTEESRPAPQAANGGSGLLPMWFCPAHLDTPVSWRGTGCHPCDRERAKARTRTRKRSRPRREP
jgi:hypothetical protein